MASNWAGERTRFSPDARGRFPKRKAYKGQPGIWQSLTSWPESAEQSKQ